MQEFVYLGSKITNDRNSEIDVLHRLAEAKRLQNIWRSSKIGTETKLRIFKSNVLGVLLYGAESWKVSQSICHVFQTRCLRRILRISNEDLYRRTNTAPLTVEIKKRRWRWLGHINRMAPNAIPRVAMRWTPSCWEEEKRASQNDRGWMDLEPDSTVVI